jgi:hypothetical protein
MLKIKKLNLFKKVQLTSQLILENLYPIKKMIVIINYLSILLLRGNPTLVSLF